MASYMYNPSSKVTEILSKFLEFDPESLEMGIWSGDLSLKNVHLKREAVKPLLNPKKSSSAEAATTAEDSSSAGLSSSSSHHSDALSNHLQDPTKRDPLRIKLVRGSIGHLRVKIPWKQMVWGQGAVQVEISDVTIVLSLQSTEETAREKAREALEEEERKRKEKANEDSDENEEEDDYDYDYDPSAPKSNTNSRDSSRQKRRKKKKDGHSRIYHKAFREAKQRRLREAERRQLNNSELASWLEQLHQKQSLAKEAHRVEQKELGIHTTADRRGRKHGRSSTTPTTPVRTPAAVDPEKIKEGRFDRYLKSFSSDLFWRLFAGVKGSIRKARIVLLQDGVEVGCIVQSIEVLAGKDGIESLEIHSHNSHSHNSVKKATASRSNNSSANNSSAANNLNTDSNHTPQHYDHYEGAYDDGEHVDKLLRQTGLGIFVRQETNRKQLSKIPSELRFSTSVEADDYILRPVAKLDIGFSFFYPYPPERRKKVTATKAAASTTTSSTTTATTNTSASSSTTAANNATASATSSVSSNNSSRRRGKRDKQPSSFAHRRNTSKDDSHLLSSTVSRTRLETIASMSPSNDHLVTPASRRSESGDTFFSDPRIPLDDAPEIPTPSPYERSSSTPTDFERRGRLRHTRSADGVDHRLVQTTLFPGATATDRRHPAQRLRTPLRGGRKPQQLLQMGNASKVSRDLGKSANFAAAASTTAGNNSETPASADVYSSKLVPDIPTHPCPRLEFRLGVDEVQVVFTTKHYELLTYLFATVARMKNGRPDRTIRSVSETEPGRELRELLRKHKKNPKEFFRTTSGGSVVAAAAAAALEAQHPEAVVAPATSSGGMITSTLSSYWWSSTSATPAAPPSSETQKSLSEQVFSPSSGSFTDESNFSGGVNFYQGRRLKSARQEVVAQWWKYAIGAIQWEIRKRKHMTSVFRDMYISFDWKKQRHRRQEYIDLYSTYKLNSTGTTGVASRLATSAHSSNMPMMGGWSSGFRARKQKEAEEKMNDIEDELSIEQILLYRSIARGMRTRGTAKMPLTVYELWGKEGLTSAGITQKRSRRSSSHASSNSPSKRQIDRAAPNRGVSFGSKDNKNNTSFDSNDLTADYDDTKGGNNDSTLLGMVQEKYFSSQRLREEGGVQNHFDEHDGSTDTIANADPDDHSVNDLSYEDLQKVPLNDVGSLKKHSQHGIRAGKFYTPGGARKEFGTIGGDLQSRLEGKSLRSSRSKRSYGGATSVDTYALTPNLDNRMRLFFSFQIKKFNVIVVEEEYLFELSPELRGVDRYLDSETSDREVSSALDLSDLSVLTDDQRFFGDETGDFDMIVEEEEDFGDAGRPKMRSTDFLAFGQPENPLLRLTITSFVTTSKGISGGGMEVGVSIASIEASGDKDAHILSMGPSEPSLPVEEVDIDGIGKRSKANKRGSSAAISDVGSIDLSTYVSEKHRALTEAMVFTRCPSNPPRQAISLKFSKEGTSRIVQSDLSKIKMSANMEVAQKLLRFYSRPDAKQPERLLTTSSRDVARKIMVKKISNSPTKTLSAITSAIRIHGIEVQVPFSYDEVNDTGDSDLDSSYLYSRESNDGRRKSNLRNYSTSFAVGIFELYSGNAVDELVQSAAIMSDAIDQSVSGGSLTSIRTQAVSRTLEMLNIAELTSSHDSFASSHFVMTMRGISCGMKSSTRTLPKLIDIPVNVEILVTNNDMSLLDTDSPKQQMVVEVSPVHLLLSEHRLELLSATKDALDFGKIGANAVVKKSFNPDPPRIEILSRRILSSLDVTCNRVRVELVKDKHIGEALLPPTMKELVMEEALADFLSIVACFDFSLPNEEALSSAMQVCIGRLVGLGLSDDEAWACTNRARANFLDGIALMRKTQSDFFVEISQSIAGKPVEEESSTVSGSYGSNDNGGSESKSSSSEESSDNGDFSDDDSNNSAQMVETTINNAVEKTVSSFSALLQEFAGEDSPVDDSTFLFVDLPMGLSLSTINLVYDQHITSLVPSLVVTNKAGIELLTLVPNVRNESVASLEEIGHDLSHHGLSFSRFHLDSDHAFGRGGLPMSVLASDEGAESDSPFRTRSKFDDVEIGELEFFFSASLFEEIIDDVNAIRPSRNGNVMPDDDNETEEGQGNSLQLGTAPVATSTVIMASSLSFLFTSDTMVPFCRLTLENACLKNDKAMESLEISDRPTFALVARLFSIHNLSPEGQFFPDVLTTLSPDSTTGFPFQVRYFQSSDHWKQSNRLEIDFNSFRLFLVRQFINDLMQYFVYDKYGVGKLRKKYEKEVVDIHGNGKPPLLYAVYFYDSSIICPRNSTNTDMMAFEVGDASIAVSYIPSTFDMPTKISPFSASPKGMEDETNDKDPIVHDSMSRSSFASLSDYEDCESSLTHCGDGPISSHSSDLKRRLTINLDRIRAYTAIAGDKVTQDIINSALFRFIHTIDGRAEDSKPVYSMTPNIDRNLYSENLLEFERCIQSWEEISANEFSLEILYDSAPHTRLLVSCNDEENTLALDARLSQLCLLLSVWDSNMQELGSMFPVSAHDVHESASPPKIPDDFPEYGSEEFVSYLENISSVKSEICCIFKGITFRCTFDEPGFFSVDPDCFQYFDDPTCVNEVKPGLVLTFEDMVVHVLNDHLDVKRIGIGASSVDLVDERRVASFQSVLSTDPGGEGYVKTRSWADLSWGLREDVATLSSSLPQPVQISVFMSPRWSMTNIGIQSANGVMHDLSWIWVLLGYFKSYYSDGAYGNMGFDAQKWSHRMKNALRKSANENVLHFQPQPGLNIDFRVWLCQPTLCLPSDYFDTQAPSLIMSGETGLWYRYKSMKDFSSQEVASTDLNLLFANEFVPPERYRREAFSGASMASGLIRSLIEGLSFGLRYDNKYQFNHKDISFVVPFSGDNIPSLSVAGKELEIEPIKLSPPSVLKPFHRPPRRFGSKVCSITCIIELFPLASTTMMNFLSGPMEVNNEFAPKEIDQPPVTFSISAKLGDIRMFLIDPDLGVQLPIAVLSLSSSTVSMSKFAPEPITDGLLEGEYQPSDMQIILINDFWIDYFKLGLTRSWEPLMEPFKFEVLYEISSQRGQGCSFNSDCPLHFNLSGALLSFLSETVESFRTIIGETFGQKAGKMKTVNNVDSVVISKDEDGAHLNDTTKTINGDNMTIIHELPKPLKGDDKVAFSMRNLTGQRIRIHQQSNLSSNDNDDKPVVLTYLNQGESVGLTFAATISVVKNLSIVEIPYPGFEISKHIEEKKQGSLNHAIDLQIPGCRWIQGVRLDSFGRKFRSLTPRSSHVFEKISRDWRLQNAMTVLTEVGPDNGGRLLSVRSIFQIRNNTTHSVKLIFHPDPRYKPDTINKKTKIIDGKDTNHTRFVSQKDENDELLGCSVIKPGCDFQLPTLLLESSLEMDGSHLGSVWVRPDTSHAEIFSFRDFSKPTESDIEDFDASFCSRPVQLAKVVHETSLIYNNGDGDDVEPRDAKSGVQVSCPTHSRSGNIRTPFCYAIEISRSPIVKSEMVVDKPFAKNKKKGKPEHAKLIHGPVAYNIEIHPPIVIVNLLPEGGRFELMHAIRKTVVWYADLKPGQQIPVHSLGLDAPLLLLVNLGFCRTPVGEGALVHHGGDSVTLSREQNVGLKSIGIAVTKGTKKIGKRLSSLAETPDKRAQDRVAKMFSPKASDARRKKGNVKHKRSLVDRGSLDLEIGENGNNGTRGKVHTIENVTYSEEDVANETTVVDSVGQRLNLRIENIRGGGGQRRISLYCPYWIVNTTEHALRYKEDKGKQYVSGTVTSCDKNGSTPVDGSNRQYRSRHEMQSKRAAEFADTRHNFLSTSSNDNGAVRSETVFAGMHGALATSPGQCCLSPEDISNLIDQDMPLPKLAGIAFMFNFHDDSLGTEKLVVQLYDGLSPDSNKRPDYTSGWSAGFTLETVGFSQVIRLPCKDGRMLELSATVNVAPGFLSGYTKIVRFCPRYAIYNRLDRPVRLWQDSSVSRSLNEDRSDATNQLGDQSDSRKWRYDFEDKHRDDKISHYESLFGRFATLDDKPSEQQSNDCPSIPEGTAAHRSALYVSSVGPSQLLPFFLPDTRSESQLRIDVGGPWNLTSSFASNVPGEHVLPISRAMDIRMLHHVSIRDAPKYKIILPPPKDTGTTDWGGELGAYFETEWVNKEERKILVKGTKRGKYAFNHTDMRVGDELLRINGISVLKMTFQEAMKVIKDKLVEIREYEEKLRQKQNGGIDSNKKGVLRRLSLGGKHSVRNALERGNSNRVLRRFSLGGKKKDQFIDDDEIVEPSPLTMTFRTQEERLRKLRVKAIRARNSAFSYTDHTIGNVDPERLGHKPIDSLTVETKALHNTMFIILRNADVENPPFKVQNRSLKYSLFYRQRNCEEHEWNILTPGESRSYSWEEPMKSKKLTVRIATNPHDLQGDHNIKEKSLDVLSDDSNSNYGYEIELDDSVGGVRADRLRQVLAYQYVNNEERGGFGLPTTVRLEEIGFQTLLPIPSSAEGVDQTAKFLNCEVDTDGGTRLLVISDLSGEHDERETMQANLSSLEKQISYEEKRSVALQSMRYALSQPSSGPQDESTDFIADDENSEEERDKAIENDLRTLMDEFPEGNSITKKCQVVVQVLEAVGLSSSDFIGTSNPYCEVFYKGRSRSRKHFLQKRSNKRKTYFIEKSTNPKWKDQFFVFDVSEEAIAVTRGHSIQIVVRDFRSIGQHPILGQTTMHFASIRNQQELVGWWPLVGRYAGNTDASVDRESDFGRGSVKLRVQWVYTLPAMIDYYLLMSHRRLLALTTTEQGMQEQLKSAEESFQRKREAMDRLPGGRIAKLGKLQKKTFANKEAAMKRDLRKKEGKKSKTGSSLNTNFLHLKETLRTSRTQSLNALTIQTVESRRRRRMESDEKDGDESNEATARRNSRSSSTSSQSESRDHVGRIAPALSPAIRKRTQSLGDYFAKQRGNLRSRRTGFEGGMNRRISHRKLSLDLDDPSVVESIIMDSNQSLLGRRQRADSRAISDRTDAQEQARRKNDIARLNALGYVFHETGYFFHEDHLPNHFRRLLFANLAEHRKSQLLYSRRFYVGRSSSVRHFKTWQAASALLWDSDIEVLKSNKELFVMLKRKSPRIKDENVSNFILASKSTISTKLSVPDEAPRASMERSKLRIEAMHISRTQFDRACRRILGCVLNPGGWLTIRPIAATNLPDSYTGMYVKVSHGAVVQTSETVDAKVSPKWSSSRSAYSSKRKGRRRATFVHPPNTAAAADFGFSDNDFHLHVEPQQTGGSIRLSVVAERYKTKVELGVVHIPLGAAIAACIDAAQSMEVLARNKRNEIPLYTRWFPLMEPDLTVPIAGDMGLSTRPHEPEQSRDNMFQQYFAPSIQLSLMWWPHDQNQNRNGRKGKNGKASPSAISRITNIPAIQSYINADISAVSVALIDSVRAMELLNLSLRDIDVKYAVTRSKTRMGLVIGWIQLDQQNDNSREPVVFAPTPSEYLQPTLQFLALKDNLRTKSNIVSYEYVGVAFQEMDLTIEEPRVYELWDFFMAVMNRKKMKQRAERGQRHADVVSQNKNIFTSVEVDESNPSLFEIMQSVDDRGALSQKKKTYVEQLILGLVKINLSYVKGKKQNFELSETGTSAMHGFAMVKGGNQEADSDQKKIEQSEIFMKWSQLTSDQDSVNDSAGAHNLPGIIAAVFPSVSDAPIRLQGKLVEHVFESPVEIVSSLKNYYTNETLKQVYKIIGSLDFVGNPTILLSSFMSGVKDLVAAPTAAFMKSPANVKQVGIGVGKGTVSFVSHSASGFFGFTARLFSQAGQATAFFSLDSDYRQWHRERIVNEATNLERVWKRRGMQNVEEMVLRPIADLFLGFSLGLTGVVMSPYKGAQKDGTRGFLIGTGVGIAGLVTKPVVGVFDALTHGSQSIHDVAKTINFLERRHQPVLKLRLPYVFGPMKILSPFDAVSARSVYLLGLFPPKTKLKNRLDKGRELHIHSEVLRMEPGVETYAIVTSIRIVLLKVKHDTTNSLAPYFCWEVDLSTGATVSSRISDHGHNGVALTITKSDDAPEQNKEFRNKESRNSKRTSSSAFSILPMNQVYEDDGGELGENFQTPQLDTRTASAKPLNELVSSGIKQQGNQTLEWFAVLAEYQQRKQLNRIHNVISCIVGTFDDVITERSVVREDVESFGKTSFGIYHFEKDLPDGRAAQISNTNIIASLEDFYWMDHDLVQRISGMSSSNKKRRALDRIRRSWDFSHDMSASKSMGGPEWLVLARAKAMAVPHHNQFDEMDDSLPTGTEHRMFAERGLNISASTNRSKSSRANVSVGDHTLGLRSTLSGNYDEAILESSANADASKRSIPSIENVSTVVGSDVPGSPVPLKRTNSASILSHKSDDVFCSENAIVPRGAGLAQQSQEGVDDSYAGRSSYDSVTETVEPDFYSPINGVMKEDGQVEFFGNSNHHPPPVTSLYVPEGQSSNMGSSSPTRTLSRHTKTATAAGSASVDSARIDRLEGIMEQLVLLNAAQVTSQVDTKGSLPSLSQHSATSEVQELAANLKQELIEIRVKMEEQAREDAALRQDIGILRDQLADRRSPSRDTVNIGTISQGIEKRPPRPPSINTQLVKKRNSFKGLFQGRKKKRENQVPIQQQGEQSHLPFDVNDSNDGRSVDYTPEPPLGLNEDLSESQASFY